MCWAGNNGTLDPSTVFVDFLGPLGGENVATWTATAANKAVQQQMQQIQAAVRSGFIARAAADWHVRTLFKLCTSDTSLRILLLAIRASLCLPKDIEQRGAIPHHMHSWCGQP